MKASQPAPTTIDQYIAEFPQEVQTRLTAIRALIRDSVPDAAETISYAIPAFTLNKRHLLYFAAYKAHVGVYPVPTCDPKLTLELAAYQTGKGTLRFPHDKPLPLDLLRRVVGASVQDNQQRVARSKR